MEIRITIDPGRLPSLMAKCLATRRARLVTTLVLCLTPLMVYAAVSKPYTFSSGTKISSSQVNANFDTVYEEVNATSDSVADVLSEVKALKEELMPSTCPSDMKLGGKAGTESSFCIEVNERGSTSYYNAVNTCMALGRHVCTQNQFWYGTTVSGVNAMCNNWEWVGDRDEAYTSGHLQVVIGGNGCTVQSWAWAGQHNNGNGNQPYRCCTGGVSALFD